MPAPDPVAALTRALLYEGYSLYPYRKSALKNAQRWFFGGVYPPAYAAANPGDPAAVSAQMLLEGSDATTLELEIRFLQFSRDDGGAEEHSVSLSLEGLGAELHRRFGFGALSGEAHLAVRRVGTLHRVDLEVRNLSPANGAREAILPATMACLHAVLRARHGAWVSLLEPPPQHAAAALACEQHGLNPVLVGLAPARDTLLASPIVLYDYPRVAPESAGDLFDATEIDEILTLRVLTLTDAEKAELAAGDPRVRALLARAEALTPAEMAGLHGAIRDRLPGSTASGGGDIAPGARVRLKPRAGGDVFDLALSGRAGTVTSVERDVDGGVHLAVVVDDDPGADLGEAGFHGHRFFFRAAEVELLP